MDNRAFTIYSLMLVAATVMGNLSACNRSHDSTLASPFASSSDATDTSQRVATDDTARSANAATPKPPYGAAAPMASGTDGLKPLNGGVDQPPLPSNPDALLDNAPTAAGLPALSASTAASSGNATPTTALTATEIAFITEAADAGLFNLRLGQLAVDRASNSAIKSYAALLVTDQATLNRNLQQLARRLGVPIPVSLSEPRQKIIDTLARTGDVDFDRQFMSAAGVQEHNDTVALFEKTGRETRDPVVRSFVLATLPTLRAQLSAAERLPITG